MVDDPFRVEQVEQRICILRQSDQCRKALDTRSMAQAAEQERARMQQRPHRLPCWVWTLRYLCERGSEHNDFEHRGHLNEELVDAGSLQHIDVVDHRLDLHRHDEVGVRDRLRKAAV